MKPSKCKICGHEHWNHEPHVFKDSGSREAGQVSDRKPQKEKTTEVEVRDIHKGEAAVGDKKIQTEGKFDRNAYQRDYMRKWRKK